MKLPANSPRQGIILMGVRSQTLGQGPAERLAAEQLDVRYIPLDLDDPATIPAAASRIGADSAIWTFLSITPA